ncbi:MAG: hypothetical protein TIS_01509 [Tissierella sp.]
MYSIANVFYEMGTKEEKKIYTSKKTKKIGDKPRLV